MIRSQAKKIAYRRAYKILQSTLSAGWDPNEGPYSYTDVDSMKILTGMNEIMLRLFYLSEGNLEDAGAELEGVDQVDGDPDGDALSI
jgi:hypothetical protein